MEGDLLSSKSVYVPDLNTFLNRKIDSPVIVQFRTLSKADYKLAAPLILPNTNLSVENMHIQQKQFRKIGLICLYNTAYPTNSKILNSYKTVNKLSQ